MAEDPIVDNSQREALAQFDAQLAKKEKAGRAPTERETTLQTVKDIAQRKAQDLLISTLGYKETLKGGAIYTEISTQPVGEDPYVVERSIFRLPTLLEDGRAVVVLLRSSQRGITLEEQKAREQREVEYLKAEQEMLDKERSAKSPLARLLSRRQRASRPPLPATPIILPDRFIPFGMSFVVLPKHLGIRNLVDSNLIGQNMEKWAKEDFSFIRRPGSAKGETTTRMLALRNTERIQTYGKTQARSPIRDHSKSHGEYENSLPGFESWEFRFGDDTNPATSATDIIYADHVRQPEGIVVNKLENGRHWVQTAEGGSRTRVKLDTAETKIKEYFPFFHSTLRADSVTFDFVLKDKDLVLPNSKLHPPVPYKALVETSFARLDERLKEAGL